MLDLSKYMNIGDLFDALLTLPEQLAAARGHVWDAMRDREEIARAMASIQDPALKAATSHDLAEMDAEVAAAKDTLANVRDKFLAVRYTVRLVEAAVTTLNWIEAADCTTQDAEDRRAARDDELPIPF